VTNSFFLNQALPTHGAVGAGAGGVAAAVAGGVVAGRPGPAQ